MIPFRDVAATALAVPVLALAFFAGAALAGNGDPAYSGPTPYLSVADSVFKDGPFGSCIEDFENSRFDIPGASGNGGIVTPGSLVDSVDGDDGAIDGSGSGGHSYFSGDGTTGITIHFDPTRTHGLPTYVGVVWTDSGALAPVSFEAFGPDDMSILLTPYGPFAHSDASNGGETAEDRLYSIHSSAGIRRVHITNVGGGIEVDHIQLDRCVLCGDANIDLSITAPDALIALKTGVGTDECRLCLCDTNNSGGTSAPDALAILRKSVGLTPVMNCPACPELL